MFSEVFERFVKDSSVAFMVRMLLENLLNADKIDRWFETVRHTQYTKEILFSSIVGLMLQVVCKIRPSVHSAYSHSEIQASVVAVYDKLKGLETTTSQGLPGKSLVVFDPELGIALDVFPCEDGHA